MQQLSKRDTVVLIKAISVCPGNDGVLCPRILYLPLIYLVVATANV